MFGKMIKMIIFKQILFQKLKSNSLTKSNRTKLIRFSFHSYSVSFAFAVVGKNKSILYRLESRFKPKQLNKNKR